LLPPNSLPHCPCLGFLIMCDQEIICNIGDCRSSANRHPSATHERSAMFSFTAYRAIKRQQGKHARCVASTQSGKVSK
jgi:hypothetical protein